MPSAGIYVKFAIDVTFDVMSWILDTGSRFYKNRVIFIVRAYLNVI